MVGLHDVAKGPPFPALGEAVGEWDVFVAGEAEVDELLAVEQPRRLLQQRGFWLAIPLPAAGKSLRGGRITPGEWERRRGLRLRFVYRRTGPSLLVVEGRLNTKGQAVVSRSKTGRGKVTAPIFLLVPPVKLPKRLDLARDADRALDSVPGLIVANWVDRI